MSQKSSVPQAVSFVSQVLKRDSHQVIQGERDDDLERKPLCQSLMYIYILYIFQWLTDSLRESTDQVIQVIISHTHEHLGSWLITWRQVFGVSKRVRAKR